MFDRLKKALSRAGAAGPSSALPGGAGGNPISEWASTQGLSYSAPAAGRNFALDGSVNGRRWRMELGRPTRDFISGEELRARAELGIDEGVAVLLLNRPLKEALEKRAYALYTDSLQTLSDARMPEELRWLSMYEEVGWDSLPDAFWDRYAILADQRENALAFVDANLAEQLMDWPDPGPGPEVPFMLMLLRGKGYLRMAYQPSGMPTLQHAAAVFTSACESAIGGLTRR